MSDALGMVIAVLLAPWIARWGYCMAGPHVVTGKFWTDEFSPEVRRAADLRAGLGG